MTVAMLGAAGTIALPGLASAAPSEARHVAGVQCPEVCIAIYEPVTCLLSDGTIQTFGNRCEAEVYACANKLVIIACVRTPV